MASCWRIKCSRSEVCLPSILDTDSYRYHLVFTEIKAEPIDGLNLKVKLNTSYICHLSEKEKKGKGEIERQKWREKKNVRWNRKKMWDEIENSMCVSMCDYVYVCVCVKERKRGKRIEIGKDCACIYMCFDFKLFSTLKKNSIWFFSYKKHVLENGYT